MTTIAQANPSDAFYDGAMFVDQAASLADIDAIASWCVDRCPVKIPAARPRR